MSDKHTEETRENALRDIVLVDYQQASEDARNRDTLLHNSFYILLIFLGIVLAGVEFSSKEQDVIPIVTSVSILALVIIFVWIHNLRTARNASYNRRSQIERKYGHMNDTEFELISSNKSVNDRLSKDYKWRKRDVIELLSPGNLFYSFILVLIVVLSVIHVHSLISLNSIGWLDPYEGLDEILGLNIGLLALWFMSWLITEIAIYFGVLKGINNSQIISRISNYI